MQVSTLGISLVKGFKSIATIAHTQSVGGLELLKGFEGCRLKAYQDTAGVWTIGWGNTYIGGKPVLKGQELPNVAAADSLLLQSLKSRELQVNTLVKVPLTQNQFDALVSFQYNTGALSVSTLLKKLNARDYGGAADEFLKWNKITKDGKKVISDVLVKRREKERRLFVTR
jgi:GH24 family phage-related lysozyme (muramidase)